MTQPLQDAPHAPPSDTPRVSIVVPCLNRERWIRPTLESIFAQTYPHVECIVMDGGSTDGTLDIVREYRGRLTLAVGEDSGQADAINKGWAKSGGDILTWLNADDLLLPDALEKAVEAFAGHPEAVVVYGDAESIDEEGKVIAPMPARPVTLEELLVCYENPITQPASFSRRTALEKAGWIDTSFRTLFDYELWGRMVLVGSLYYLPERLAQARCTSEYSLDRMAHDGVHLIRTLLRNPALPPAARRLRGRAMSAAHIRASWYAWKAERHKTRKVLGHLLRAFFSSPSNVGRVWQEWLSFRRYHADTAQANQQEGKT